MEGLLIVVIAVLMFLGHIFTDNAWRSDCDRLGKTRSYGAVYECKKIQEPEKAAERKGELG